MVVMAAVYAQWYSVSMGETARPYTEEKVSAVGAAHVAAAGKTLPPSPIEDTEASIGWYASDGIRLESGPQEPHYFPPTLYPTLGNSQTSLGNSQSLVEAATVSSQGGQLSEAEMRALLAEAGWEDALIPEALAVFCGINNRSGFPRGESGCSPGAVGDSGNSLGLAQLNGDTWAPYCGVPRAALIDALTNLQCARKVYQYDIDRAYGAWNQWTVKP